MSLINTKIQNWRVQTALDKNESRQKLYGALDKFVEDSESPMGIVTPELKEKALRSMGTSVQVPVLDYNGAVTVSDARTCVIEDLENTSNLSTLSFATYQVGFTMVPGAYQNNEISYDRDFARKMEQATRALLAAIDTACVAALEAGKTQVLATDLGYTVTANSVQVPANQSALFFNNVNSMMLANNFYGSLSVIGNPALDAMIRNSLTLGATNAQNQAISFADKTVRYSNQIANAAGKVATGYVVEDGNVGLVTRVDREALRGAVANGHEWGTTTLPGLGSNLVGYHYYTAVGDQSATAGAATADITCGVKEYFGFSIDVAVMTAYNSAIATRENPIIKYEIATDANGIYGAFPVNNVGN